jgi:hypothetical protein
VCVCVCALRRNICSLDPGVKSVVAGVIVSLERFQLVPSKNGHSLLRLEFRSIKINIPGKEFNRFNAKGEGRPASTVERVFDSVSFRR